MVKSCRMNLRSQKKKKEETDMKTIKKLTAFMLAICLAVACFSMSVFAADGKIMFTDPQVKAGETVEVTGVVQKTAGNFGKIEITMKYDTDMLKFKSGDGITESQAGEITYKGDATHDVGARKEFKFSFTALKEGTTKIEITSATIKNVSGTVLDYTKGSSTVTIAEGTGVPPTTTTATATDATVEVNGVPYQIGKEFPDDVIPDGYERTTLEYDLEQYNVVYSEDFGLYLAYLTNEENVSDFFMYVEADATFAPYEEIEVNDSLTLALLSDVSDVVLPEDYKATTVLLNEHEFPAWQTENADGFCILYAINSNGEKSLYQLDNTEGTYQRFVAPEVNEDFADDSIVGKLSNLLENHLDYVILGTGLGFLLFLLIIIILSVKLYNRNAELDEIYEEYGIDVDEDTKDDEEDEIDDEDETDDADITEDELKEASLFVQEGMKELTQESLDAVISVEQKDCTKEIVFEIPTEEDKQPVQDMEATLGKALEEVSAQKEDKEDLYDDDDLFENFSVDFIDLDE